MKSEIEKLKQALAESQQRCKDLEALLKMDDKTTLLNKSGFYEAVSKAWRTARRNNEHISILHIDVDNMGVANEHYGEEHVDANILKPIGDVIEKHTRRAVDASGRLFGDAFLTVLYATDGKGAHAIAQSIVDDVAAMEIPNKESIITVSVGCASSAITHPRTLQKMASTAMYQAKDNGKNQVKLSGDHHVFK